MGRVLTGLDRVREGKWQTLKGMRLGLVANQASLDSGLTSARDLMAGLLPGALRALYGPQHGYGGEEQDNMDETPDGVDPVYNIPVYSLYAETREPVRRMLDGIDVLVVDLQDVGTRVYTFASTMLNCLRAAGRAGVKVMVLDRPNPLGGDIIEGSRLQPDYYSFVGPWSLPMRHGLTMGEMARMFARVFDLDCELEVVSMEGWRRWMMWGDTGLRWIMPSPNMPFPGTALVYPGQVIWEGTNLSEGRGTCRPFEIFGAPFLEPYSIRKVLDQEALAGCLLQEYTFRPTFQKWADENCRGFMLHVTDPVAFRPYMTSLGLLAAVLCVHKRDFRWAAPPYEYEFKKRPIDVILGRSDITEDLKAGAPLASVREKWEAEIDDFLLEREEWLLYS